MDKFNTLLEAAQLAATRCGSWSFATSDDRYDVKGLLVLAELSDSEDPIDEDSFYVVSSAGAIGLCNDGEDIDWLFLSDGAPNEVNNSSFAHLAKFGQHGWLIHIR
jgi:hypothetical protein